MATKTYTFTEEEARAIAILVNNAEHDADNTRMLTRPGSPQEAAATADQDFIRQIQAKMAGREFVSVRA